MKICLVGDATSIHVLKWVKWFSKRHDVHLISDKSVEIPNATIHFAGSGSGMPSLIKKALRTRSIIIALNPDIIHAHSAVGYGIMAASCGRHPLIISIWGSDITLDSYDLVKRFALKYALNRADAISAYDAVLVDRLAELGYHDIVRKRIVGIDMKEFNQSRMLDKIPGIDKKPSVLLFSARPLNSRGGVETLIRAMPKVVDQFSDAKLMLAYSKGDLEKSMKDLAESLDIKENVVFFGKVEHDNMPGLMATSRIFVDTFMSGVSRSDIIDKCPGLGAAAMEAMACGTPTVIPMRRNADTNCPYVPYLHQDPGSLADAIIKLNDEAMHTMMAKKGLGYIKEVASEETIMTEWEKFYSALAPKRSQN